MNLLKWLLKWLLCVPCPNCESGYEINYEGADSCVVCADPKTGETRGWVWRWCWLHRHLVSSRNLTKVIAESKRKEEHKQLVEAIKKDISHIDISRIDCIYDDDGNSFYDEPVDRLAGMIARDVEEIYNQKGQ